MAEYRLDEELLRVVFFDKSKYVISFAVSRQVLVASYNQDNVPNRVIDIGFDMIGDIILMPVKFFGVTHPQKKIISFFELDEKECMSELFKKCDPYNLFSPISCNIGSYMELSRCRCQVGYFRSDEGTCQKCDISCKTKYCTGPEPNACVNCYNANQVEKDGVCTCNPGFGYFNSIKQQCSSCPGNCHICDQKNPKNCEISGCKSFFTLDIDTKKCYSCVDEKRPQKLVTPYCPEPYQIILAQKESGFKDNEQYIELYLDRQTFSTKSNPNVGAEIQADNDLDWLQTLHWQVTVNNKPDQELVIEKYTYNQGKNVTEIMVNNQKIIQNKVQFWLEPGQLLHFQVNKKIKVTYKQVLDYVGNPRQPIHVLNWNVVGSKRPAESLILDNSPLFLDIVESEDSNSKLSLLNLKSETKKDEDIKKEQPVASKKIDSVAQSAKLAVLATLTIFVRFFVVVDIVINLFGKINVELGPRIGKIVIFLKQLQFPTLGLTERSSPIDDGGDEAINLYQEKLKNKSNKTLQNGKQNLKKSSDDNKKNVSQNDAQVRIHL